MDHKSRFEIIWGTSIGLDTASLYEPGAGRAYKVPSQGCGTGHVRSQRLVIATASKIGLIPAGGLMKYVPAGFKPSRVDTYAVRGHEYPDSLSADKKSALIAFLKTL